MSPSLLTRLALLVSIPLGIAACFVDSSDSRSATSTGSAPTAGSSSGSGSSSGGGGDGSPSEHPILAKVDTDQTMQVSPGQGVGVFAEYVSGGHWHVWWTCDTAVNAQGAPCAFGVKITVPDASIARVTSQQFASADTLTTAAGEIDAATSTSTQFDGLLFDTTPGQTITVAATVGGLYDGRFLFFVENGQIDDGYQGTVTDPIELAPTTP